MKLPNVLSDGFLQAMPQGERSKLGRAGMTSGEASKIFVQGEERKLQGLIHNWLCSNQIYFVRPRMDKKTTTAKGTADFIVCVKDSDGAGRFLCIEAKTKYGSLTVEQSAVMAEATKSGAIYCVARNLEEVIAIVGAIKGGMSSAKPS